MQNYKWKIKITLKINHQNFEKIEYFSILIFYA